MTQCKRCGQCCVFCTVVLENKTKESDHLEIEKWIQLHHCDTQWVEDYKGKPALAIRIPMPCKYLDFDTSTNTAHCTIFGKPERPKLCSEWFCDAAKGD